MAAIITDSALLLNFSTDTQKNIQIKCPLSTSVSNIFRMHWSYALVCVTGLERENDEIIALAVVLCHSCARSQIHTVRNGYYYYSLEIG